MALVEHFNEGEIPYETLKKFGLTQEMIDDLPETVMKKFLNGGKTPVLPVRLKNVDGQLIESQANMSLLRLENGEVEVAFEARWMDKDLSAFSERDQELLTDGEVIICDLPGKGKCYVQFDETINQAIAVPVEIVKHNLALYGNNLNLDDDDREALENGGLVEIEINNITFTMGIDLAETDSVRVVEGSIGEWKKLVAAEEMPEYQFGLYGCWVRNPNNTLSYVPEDEYSEEMQQQVKIAGLRNASEQQTKGMSVG